MPNFIKISFSGSKIRSEGIDKSPIWPGFGNPGRAKLDLLRLIASVGLITVFILAQRSPSRATPVLSVTGTGANTYPGHETTYHLELLNHTDQIVYDGILSATLPISFTYVPGSTIALGEGWPMESREPIIQGQTLTWGPYHLPAAGIQVHNPYGIHTLMESCDGIPALHLEGAKTLVGNGGYVTQLFYPIDTNTTGPSQCAVNYVQEIYARNLIPILRLQGHRVNGIWQAPDPGPDGDYSEIAQAYANFVAGLPRRNTNPLYIAVWNEPDLWIEWSGQPNANQYARFFVAVSKAIRQLGDARIRLVNGALTPGNTAFLDRMLRVGGFRDAFDVWASHCYPYNHPAWYNNHEGTAQYGTYAIDCYLEELAVIQGYGRGGVKVILTETGYQLGDDIFGFEGFPRINETNRANYISSAFSNYWQNWPEIVAVTPFELADASGHWANFDWVYPYYPYPTHLQYDTVATLPKPSGQLEPYGYQIIFKARVGTDVPTGTYTIQLSGSDRDGHTAFLADAAPVTIFDPGDLQFIYLPVILKAPGTSGPWYQATSQATPTPAHDGAIVPTEFLTAARPALQSLAIPAQITKLPLADEPVALAVAEATGLGAIILTDGTLETVDLISMQSTGTVFVGEGPQAMTPGSPGTGQVYVSLQNGLARVDVRTGQVINRRVGLGRIRGLAWDPTTQRLFAADAEHDRLLVFQPDLSSLDAVHSLDHQPDQLFLDSANRQLYLSFPAASQVIAVDADNLTTTARASLIGGPILDLAFDAKRHRLYALSALAPGYRGLTAWLAPTLSQTALVAGSFNFPLRYASALTVTPAGDLLISEMTDLWQIDPDTFTITHSFPADHLAPAGGLSINRNEGSIYMLDLRQASLLRISP